MIQRVVILFLILLFSTILVSNVFSVKEGLSKKAKAAKKKASAAEKKKNKKEEEEVLGLDEDDDDFGLDEDDGEELDLTMLG